MALNPPQLMDGTPTRLEREYFILSRGNISFTLNLPQIGKKSGKGWLVVTTARIVLINQTKSDVRSFDIPFAYMFNEKFKQPLFGDDYFAGILFSQIGSVKPLFDLISGDITFKISFTKGCGKFLRAVKQTVEVIRQNRNRGPTPHFIHHCSSGAFGSELQQFDKNDPSHIFYYQPPSGHYAVRPASASVSQPRHQSALLKPGEIPMVPMKRASLDTSHQQPLYPQGISAYPEPPTSLQHSNISLESGWKLGSMAQGSHSARPGITTGIPVSQLMHGRSEVAVGQIPRSSYGTLQENYAIN